jgi:hypothetical protein
VAALNDVLVVNAGSTSLKLSLVDADERSLTVASLDQAPPVRLVGHRIVWVPKTRFYALASWEADPWADR